MAELKSQYQNYPNRKVGLIPFNSEVHLAGDCSVSPVEQLSGDFLNDYEKLLEKSQSMFCRILSQPISQSYDRLFKFLADMEEDGMTALGPALLCGVGLASKGKKGSKVIICTDGLANVGLGNLDGEERSQQGAQFYKDVAQYAAGKGISVSVMTLKGSGCSVKNLSKLSQATNGVVSRVDGDSIGKDIRAILNKQLYGTNA